MYSGLFRNFFLTLEKRNSMVFDSSSICPPHFRYRDFLYATGKRARISKFLCRSSKGICEFLQIIREILHQLNALVFDTHICNHLFYRICLSSKFYSVYQELDIFPHFLGDKTRFAHSKLLNFSFKIIC